MQNASSVILIRPTGFGYDPETAESNGFQQQRNDPRITRQAEEEFDGLLDALRNCGIRTTVLDPVDPKAPNAVFPNNWFSTHADGTVVIYPMHTLSRRSERDPDMQATMQREGFSVRQVIDLHAWEQQGLILEGTGSLVLDRVARFAYACLSPRTSEIAVNAWCEALGYVPITFTATMDGTLTGQPVYHTNVVMSIGTRFAVVCFDALPYPAERTELEEELAKAGKEVIPITLEQMHQYVGNMLELRGTPAPGRIRSHHAPATDQGVEYLLLSETAFLALAPFQRQALQRYTELVPVPIPTIEAVGGGSVRCMLAENFLGSK
ncbi:MAG: amidinotransferase [Flavobacteriales bacterium]|nr:amidinotransferase [Flavobacteriales bacterium]